MAARAKQKAQTKKAKGTVRTGKAAAKKTAGSSSGKKTPRGSSVTKVTGKKKTAAGRKPAAAKKAPAASARSAKKTTAVKAKSGQDRLQELRKMLIGKKEAIVREAKNEIAKYISGENRQLVETALDEGDWAVVDISEDINLRRLAAHRRGLHDIDEALRKIREGSYGTCEECGEEIGEKRLQVLPAATLCVGCQGIKEQLEALEREDSAV